VRADGKNLIGHAGVVLLRKVADRVGLAAALGAALPKGAGPGWRDRGMVPVQLACAIALGATNVLEAEQLQYHWRPVSDSTLRRALETIDGPVAARVERVRAAIRRVVWTLLALRPGGFPWISVCGRKLTSWYVLDLDATIVTCTSRKEGAAGTFKGSYGHHPRVCRDAAAARQRAVQRRRRPPKRSGRRAARAPAATVVETAGPDRRRGLQPRPPRPPAGADHESAPGALGDRLGHQRKDEQAIALLPEKVWTAALRQDGEVHEIKGPDGDMVSYQVAELTGLRDLTGWPPGRDQRCPPLGGRSRHPPADRGARSGHSLSPRPHQCGTRRRKWPRHGPCRGHRHSLGRRASGRPEDHMV
jgi:hypothetical protein